MYSIKIEISNTVINPVKPALAKAVLSPCIGVCALDDHGLCTGCWRTGAEIGDWLSMTDAQRSHLMEQVLPAREASSA